MPTLTEAREAIQTKYIDRPDYADGIVRCLRRFSDSNLYERTKDELARYGYSDEQIKEAGVWFKRMKGIKI